MKLTGADILSAAIGTTLYSNLAADSSLRDLVAKKLNGLPPFVREVDDLLQELHNQLYRAQTTESALVLMESVGKARLLLSRYRSALPIDFKQATDQGGWQPIATAPKDGTVIVVYATGQNDEGDDGPCVEVACWSKDDYGFMPHDEDDAEALRPCVLDPSHWMPVIGDNFAPPSEAAPTLLGVADGDAVGGKSGGAA